MCEDCKDTLWVNENGAGFHGESVPCECRIKKSKEYDEYIKSILREIGRAISINDPLPDVSGGIVSSQASRASDGTKEGTKTNE